MRLVFLPSQAAASTAAVKAVSSGSGPSARNSLSCASLSPRTSSIAPKRRGSLKVTGGARRHMEHDVVVGAGLAARMMELAGSLVARLVRDAERAGHAEMHDQHLAVVELGQEILGPAAERAPRAGR